MKVIPIIGVFLFQLIILSLLLFDYIYLSTAFRTLLMSTAIYSLGVAIFTSSYSTKLSRISWILSFVIISLSIIRFYNVTQLIDWEYIAIIMFIQIHLLFIAQQKLTVQKNRLNIIGLTLLIVEISNLLKWTQVSSIFLLALLGIYSTLILIGIIYKRENIKEELS